MCHDPYERLKLRLVGPGGAFELKADGLDQPFPQFKHGPSKLRDIVARGRSFSARRFIISAQGARTFGEIFGAADGLSRALDSQGVGPGARITLEMETTFDWVAGFVALTSVGAVPVLMDPRWDENTRAELADHIGCHLRLRAIPPEPAFKLPSRAVTSSNAGTQDEAIIAFTSGSTGQRKAVVIDHRALTTGLQSMMLLAMLNSTHLPQVAPGPPRQPVSFTFSPLHYIGGYTGLLFAMITGSAMALHPTWDGEAVELATVNAVRSIGGVTRSHLLDLLHTSEGDAQRLLALRTVNYFGAELEPALVDRFVERFPGVELSSGYGLTETSGIIASATLDDLRHRPGTVGRVSPAVNVRVVDGQGLEVRPGQTGRIEVRGAVVNRYLTKEAADEPRVGWFSTGDDGRLDEEGYLYVLGRRRRAELDRQTLDLTELERIVRALPGVREAIMVLDEDRNRVAIGVAPLELDLAALERAFLDRVALDPSLFAWASFHRLPQTGSGKVALAEAADMLQRFARPVNSPASMHH